MAKSVLISIQPKWCELITQGKKTVEIRKTRPKLETPFKVYIYCTKPKSKHDWGLCLEDGKVGFVCNCNYDAAIRNGMKILSGKIIGEFVCDEIITAELGHYSNILLADAQIDALDLMEYANEKTIYGWHISNLVIYENPKELSEFYKEDFEEIYSSWEDLFSIGVPEDCPVSYPPEPKEEDYIVKRPPQSWCYVEELE